MKFLKDIYNWSLKLIGKEREQEPKTLAFIEEVSQYGRTYFRVAGRVYTGKNSYETDFLARNYHGGEVTENHLWARNDTMGLFRTQLLENAQEGRDQFEVYCQKQKELAESGYFEIQIKRIE